MKNVLVLISLIFLFISCGNTDMDLNMIDYSDTTSLYTRKHCIEGKLFYYSNPGIANKLNDDGTPVKCKIVNEVVVEIE